MTLEALPALTLIGAEVRYESLGRTLIVKLETETIEAELVEANDNFIILSWTAREQKKLGKGKETVRKRQEIPYTEIKEAVVTVTF